jgi:hypothetical protein
MSLEPTQTLTQTFISSIFFTKKTKTPKGIAQGVNAHPKE